MYILLNFYIFTAKTLPITTVSTNFGSTLASAKAALAAIVCNSEALVFLNLPPYVPKGVRFALTIKTPEINKTIAVYTIPKK